MKNSSLRWIAFLLVITLTVGHLSATAMATNRIHEQETAMPVAELPEEESIEEPLEAPIEEPIEEPSEKPIEESIEESEAELQKSSLSLRAAADSQFFEQLAAGGEVSLEADLTISADTSYTIASNTVLDLNGHTLTSDSDTRSVPLFRINEAVSFEIKDSAGNGKIYVSAFTASPSAGIVHLGEKNASFILSGGTIQTDNLGESSYLIQTTDASDGVTIRGGTLTAGLSTSTSRVLNNAGTFNMENGIIEVKNVENTSFDLTAISNAANAQLNLTGGELHVISNAEKKTVAISAGSKTKMVLSGITVNVKNVSGGAGDTIAIANNNSSAVTIDKTSKISAISCNGTAYAVAIHSPSAKVFVKGDAQLYAEATGTGNARTISMTVVSARIESIEGSPAIRAKTKTGISSALHMQAGTAKSVTGGTFEAVCIEKPTSNGLRTIYVNNTNNTKIEKLANAKITVSAPEGSQNIWGILNLGTIGTIENCNVSGGRIGIENRNKITEIKSGTFSGSEYGVYNMAKCTITKISGGVFQGAEAGAYNTGIFTTISDGSFRGGEFGLSSSGTVTSLGGGTFSGSLAGAYISGGTLGEISGNVTIDQDTPWGIVYSMESCVSVPNGTNQVSGATRISTDADANYKDVGIVPTITSGKRVFANGLDLTIDARNGSDKGCVVSWKNDVFGKQSFDTGEDNNYYVHGGSYGKKEGQAADQVGTTLVTNPQPGNATQDTITITMNGGTLAGVFAGGVGNTHVTGTVVMNLNGGTASRFSGGGYFGGTEWGTANWGRGWAIVDNSVMNINGPITVKYAIMVAGSGVTWNDNATLNLNSNFKITDIFASEINISGEGLTGTADTVRKTAYGDPLDKNQKYSLEEALAMIQSACFTNSAALTRKEDGVGTVIKNVTVNVNAQVNPSIHGGNYGGTHSSYVDQLTVNVNNGGQCRLSVADTYGHVDKTFVNVENGGVITNLTQCRRGTTGNLTVDIAEQGNVQSIRLGKIPSNTGEDKNFVGGTEDYFDNEDHGGITFNSIVRINNENVDVVTPIELYGGVVLSDVKCTGNTRMIGGVNSNLKEYWGFIRKGAEYMTSQFSWNGSTADYGQQGYLLVTDRVYNDGNESTANLVLGKDAEGTGIGEGHMYVYQGQLTKDEYIGSTLETKLKKDGITVVLGEIGAARDEAKINGVSLAQWNNAPVPACIWKNADGSYQLFDKEGNVIDRAEWQFDFYKEQFIADPNEYKGVANLSLRKNDILHYTLTRQGVTLFGKTEVVYMGEMQYAFQTDKESLQFGTDFTTAQELTVKNTGNQTITLKEIADEVFYYTWDKKTLAPGESAKLTVTIPNPATLTGKADKTVNITIEEADIYKTVSVSCGFIVQISFVSDSGYFDRDKQNIEHGETLEAVKYMPNEGLLLEYFVADKDVELKDGTMILAGHPILEKQIKEIVATDHLTLTAVHKAVKEEATITDFPSEPPVNSEKIEKTDKTDKIPQSPVTGDASQAHAYIVMASASLMISLWCAFRRKLKDRYCEK